MEYRKPWLSFESQADMLIDERGLVANREYLIEHLKRVGYYRLSGYWYIFKRSPAPRDGLGKDDRFVEGTSFSQIWNLYTFDRQFRLVVLDAIERVEIYLRTELAYQLAHETGPFGFEQAGNLPRFKRDQHEEFIERCKRDFNRSREPFVIHFKNVYGDEHELPPYWILVNVMDFGTMLKLFNGAPVEVRQAIARDLGVSTNVLASWLVAINTVRNICAHHGRLWNRGLGTRPKIPNKNRYPEWHDPYPVHSDKMFGIVTILSYLLERIAPNSDWRNRLFHLLKTRSPEELSRMGFAKGWQQCPLWIPHLPKGEDTEFD